MNQQNADALNTQSILENLTRTLLYEGYSLYPYHRSAVKNQKPVPFGVVFPLDYNKCNAYAQSKMQTECIVTGSDDPEINISIQFLHLKKTESFEDPSPENAGNDLPVSDLSIKGKAGWQTIERKLSSGDLRISQLIHNNKVISVEFDEMYQSNYLDGESGKRTVKQINSVSQINGTIIIAAVPLNNQNSFRITVTITNRTPLENPETFTRDQALSRCFLSTHTILTTQDAEFISHQDPAEKWKSVIAECENINTWPILIDKGNTTLLSSPIILYDYPEINPQSSGDLFDSTEIEEALLLHVAVLSDDEKQRIAQGDEKLHAMLNKVSRVTPEELINFHSGLKDSTQNSNNKKSEL